MKKGIVLIWLLLIVLSPLCFDGVFAAEKGKSKTSNDPRLKSAEEVMMNVRALARVYEEGDHLVVEFHEYLFPYDINNRLRFVRAVADADCIIKGKPRLIFYYNPDGKQIAQADPVRGIRLKD